MDDPKTPQQSQPEPPKPKAVELRAGDADRRRTASLLHAALGRGQLSIVEFDERTAQAWAATYLSQLAPLTADLVTPPQSAGAAHESAAAYDGAVAAYDMQPPASERVTGDGGPSLSIAVWSGFERKGMWTIPPRFTAVAVMGGGCIDLRHANLGAQQVAINAVAIMGGIEIIVPDDVKVVEKGIGFMGAFSDERKWKNRPATLPADAPTIVVRGLALMGGVSITRKPAGPSDEAGRRS